MGYSYGGAGSLLLPMAFSSCGQRGYSARWRSGFSCGGAQALNPRTSVGAVHGLSNCGAQA